MGYHLTRAVYESALPARLKSLAALIAHLVRDKAKDDGTGTKLPRMLFASVAMLAQYMGCRDVARTRRRLHELVRLGVLEEVERGGGRRRFGNRIAGIRTTYVLRPERLPQLEHGCPSRTAGVCAPTLAERPVHAPTNPSRAARALPGIPDVAGSTPVTSPERSRTASRATAHVPNVIDDDVTAPQTDEEQADWIDQKKEAEPV